MNIILTGITGNIGYEVARILLDEANLVIPVIRGKNGNNIPQRLSEINPDFSKITEFILADLENEIPKFDLKNTDCIIHCAGVVHFKKSGNSNERMMENLLVFAHGTSIPIYYVSTAYLFKPHNEPLFNEYEVDKSNAENRLALSGSPHTVLRPSIVTGNSQTGRIVHFSGYYLIVPAFLEALRKSEKIRFPSIKNTVNIIPADWVARSIVDAVKSNERGTFYITNQNPPSFDALLNLTLSFYGLDNRIDFVGCSFDEYKNLDLSDEEERLFNACMPFIPYLVTGYDFPVSLCKQSLDSDYIGKILKRFNLSQNERLGK